ncbi:MAG: NGG1p interacting factor NIF3 [Pseudomonadota bacterium]
MFLLCFYVPASSLEAVKSAVFAAGAGHVGYYDQCCWETPGQAQFRPLAGSAPALGEQDQVHVVDEYRVEVICQTGCIRAAVDALLAAHPYEEPAWHVLRTVDELPD